MGRCNSLNQKSGRRGSNPRRPAWEAGILPLNYSRWLANQVFVSKYAGFVGFYRAYPFYDIYRFYCRPAENGHHDTARLADFSLSISSILPLGHSAGREQMDGTVHGSKNIAQKNLGLTPLQTKCFV
jgi:hypothetical protein